MPACTLSTAPTDEALLRAAATADTRAFEELYSRHHLRVFAFARRLCGEQALAEEVTQDVFVSLWRHAERFDPQRGTVVAWLIGITRQRAYDGLRRRRRHERHRATGEGLSDLLESPDRTDTAVERRDRAATVRSALRRLPDAQRQAVVLAYIGELSHTEISDLTGDPMGTVKGRIRLGLAKLQCELDRSGTTAALSAGGARRTPRPRHGFAHAASRGCAARAS